MVLLSISRLLSQQKKKKVLYFSVLLVRAQPLLGFSLEGGKVQWELLVPAETPQGQKLVKPYLK